MKKIFRNSLIAICIIAAVGFTGQMTLEYLATGSNWITRSVDKAIPNTNPVEKLGITPEMIKKTEVVLTISEDHRFKLSKIRTQLIGYAEDGTITFQKVTDESVMPTQWRVFNGKAYSNSFIGCRRMSLDLSTGESKLTDLYSQSYSGEIECGGGSEGYITSADYLVSNFNSGSWYESPNNDSALQLMILDKSGITRRFTTTFSFQKNSKFEWLRTYYGKIFKSNGYFPYEISTDTVKDDNTVEVTHVDGIRIYSLLGDIKIEKEIQISESNDRVLKDLSVINANESFLYVKESVFDKDEYKKYINIYKIQISSGQIIKKLAKKFMWVKGMRG